MKKHFAVLALSLSAALPALADALACPDLSKTAQVATCPSEEELQYTYNGFCSDDRRLYAKDHDTCASYQNYRKEKNVALWESADGVFQGYVSCDLQPAAVKALKPAAISVSKQGKLTRLACTYPDGVVFTYRTKANCKVQGDGKCAADPAACKAVCE